MTDSIHNIKNKTQTATQNSAVNPQTTYNNTYTYPAPGSAHPHSPTAIGEFNLTTDANRWERPKRPRLHCNFRRYEAAEKTVKERFGRGEWPALRDSESSVQVHSHNVAEYISSA